MSFRDPPGGDAAEPAKNDGTAKAAAAARSDGGDEIRKEGAGVRSADLDDAALARVLDGLGPAQGAADAHARASADVAALTRALGLIGDELSAGDDAPFPAAGAPSADAATADAGAVDGSGAPADPDQTGRAEGDGDAEVVPLPWWLRRPSHAVVAAAASLTVILGLALPAALNDGIGLTGGGSDSAEPVAQQPAQAAAGRAEESELDEALTRENSTGAEAFRATPESAPQQAAGAAAEAPAADAPAAQASAADAAAATSKKSGKAAKGSAEDLRAAPSFAEAVACARAIVVGQVADVVPGARDGRYRLTLRVTEWITPESGPGQVTYVVTGPTAAVQGPDEQLRAGQRRLFIVPDDKDARVRTFTAPYDDVRERIASARDRADGDC